MMKKILVYLYGNLSPEFRKILGRIGMFGPLRDVLLRTKGKFRETKVMIQQEYNGNKIEFPFYASIQVAAKAKEKGVESTLLRSSLRLMEKIRGRNRCLTVLDIGSNFGYLSLVWSKTLASNGRVVAFEPNSEVLKSFQKSVGDSSLNGVITIENIALGNENKDVRIYNYSTTSNISKSFNSHLAEVDQALIKMMKLDDYVSNHHFEAIDLIKIDVDGIELEILEGAKATIRKFRPILVVELNEQVGIINFLKTSNYVLRDLKLNRCNGEKSVLNIFAIPAEQEVLLAD